MTLKVLDLFSGIGGFSLGLERTGGFETVAFCEIEPFPQKILAKHWPKVPIYYDVRKLTAERLAADGIGTIDVVCGGYPCQPFSTAGKRMGDKDDRHLWPEVRRILDECGPTWFIGENVTGHISMGLDEVLSDLEALEYTARAFVIPACAVDAPHRRDRVWIVANANSGRLCGQAGGQVELARGAKTECRSEALANTEGRLSESDHRSRIGEASKNVSRPYAFGGSDTAKPDVPNPESNGRQQGQSDGRGRHERTQAGQEYRLGDGVQTVAHSDSERGCSRSADREDAEDAWKPSRHSRRNRSGLGPWLPEPSVGRVANGVPRRVDRLKSLGNAVVPQIVETIGLAVLDSLEART